MNGTEPLLEAHIFDFAGDLYRRHLEVEFVEKLREERKFASLEAMVMQMHDDARRARDILEGRQPEWLITSTRSICRVPTSR